MTANGTNWQQSPAGQQMLSTFSEEKTLHAIERLLQKVETLEKAVAQLTVLADQGSGLAAMVGDIADETYRKADAQGINLDERFTEAGKIVEKLTAPDMVKKLDSLMELADQSPGLAATAMDVFDENMKSAIARGIDPVAVGEVLGTAMEALSKSHHEPTPKVGVFFGVMRAFGDPDRQRAIGFIMNFLKHLGQKI